MLTAYTDSYYEGLWRSKQVIDLIADDRVDTVYSIWAPSFPGTMQRPFRRICTWGIRHDSCTLHSGLLAEH